MELQSTKIADDIDLLEEDRDELQENLKRFNEARGLRTKNQH